MSWFARTFDAGRITAPVPPGTDAVTEPPPDANAEPFGPDLVRAWLAPTGISPFAGSLPMRMRGLEPAPGGKPPDDTPRPGATQQDKKPRTSGVFRLSDQSERDTARHGETAQDTPDLVPIWSERPT